MTDPTRLHHRLALGENPETGGHGGPEPGYKKGGSVSKRTPHAGHHNMDGTIGRRDHHHSHKTHGHHVGVHHHATGGVVNESGSAKSHQSGCCGPSDNQFGSHEPHGGTIGKW